MSVVWKNQCVWNDVDLDTGELESMYVTYRKQLKDADMLKTNVHLEENRATIVCFLATEEEQVKADKCLYYGGYVCIIIIIMQFCLHYY